MKQYRMVWIVLCVISAVAGLHGGLPAALAQSAEDDAHRETQGDPAPDIEWFKQELKIDTKYTEQHEGILGMSWAHFITMAFLVIFFFGALMAYHRRTIRTTRILEQLLKED